jgi:hypothetical protein
MRTWSSADPTARPWSPAACRGVADPRGGRHHSPFHLRRKVEDETGLALIAVDAS